MLKSGDSGRREKSPARPTREGRVLPRKSEHYDCLELGEVLPQRSVIGEWLNWNDPAVSPQFALVQLGAEAATRGALASNSLGRSAARGYRDHPTRRDRGPILCVAGGNSYRCVSKPNGLRGFRGGSESQRAYLITRDAALGSQLPPVAGCPKVWIDVSCFPASFQETTCPPPQACEGAKKQTSALKIRNVKGENSIQ